jgi:hypothetical protein
MRGIVAGLGSVTVTVAGLALCLLLAAYGAVKQGLSAAPAGGSVTVGAPNEPPASV